MNISTAWDQRSDYLALIPRNQFLNNVATETKATTQNEDALSYNEIE